MEKFTVEELLELLDKEYAFRQPTIELTPFDQGKLAGAYEVIEYLRLKIHG